MRRICSIECKSGDRPEGGKRGEKRRIVKSATFFCKQTPSTATLTTVTAEDFLVDDGGDRETVETVGERLPQLDVVTTLAWLVVIGYRKLSKP